MTREYEPSSRTDMRRFDTVISADELLGNLDHRDWRIVDCRFDLMAPGKGYEDFLSGHIPGAVYANLDTDLAGPIRRDSGRHPLPDLDQFAATLGRWGISNHCQVIAYDYASGALAARLWWMLRWLGHADIAVLNGGIAAWLRAGGRLQEGPTTAETAQFTARPDATRILNTAELALHPQTIRMIDARDRQRFRGLAEPIDAVAGHIPGARNLPFSELLGPDGRFLPAADLQERLLGVLGDAPARPWAAMCGSGVTACHLALAAEIARFTGPRLYVGSWSEWIRDPARPVATGND
jgi:thiosulfate/3-mercaptopyruvate sulfurtransferase